MPVTTLRASGGAVVMSVPRKLPEIVSLRAGSKVEIGVKGDGLVVNPARQSKPRYTLEYVSSQCGRDAFRKSRADSDWLALRTIDYRAKPRDVRFVERAPEPIVQEALAFAQTLVMS